MQLKRVVCGVQLSSSASLVDIVDMMHQLSDTTTLADLQLAAASIMSVVGSLLQVSNASPDRLCECQVNSVE